MKKLFAIIAANKIILFATALLALAYLPFGEIYYENLATYDSGWAFLNQWSLWDANSYIQIARDGYFDRYFAYFPLFPILLKIGSLATAGNYALAGLLINLILSFGAALAIYKICKLEFRDEKAALWSTTFLFFFPTAFFFTALYTEALFLFLAASTMYFLRQRNWLMVAGMAFFAAMTREVGGMLLFPILYVVWRDRKPLLRPGKILATASPILGVLAVLGIYYVASGDPLIFLEKHSEFGKTMTLPHVPIIDAVTGLFLGGFAGGYHAWNIFSLLFTIILTYYVYKLLPKEYFIYCIAVLLPGLLSSNLEGYSRYLLVAFPIFMILGKMFEKKYWKTFTLSLYVVLFVLLIAFCSRYVMGGADTFPFDQIL